MNSSGDACREAALQRGITRRLVDVFKEEKREMREERGVRGVFIEGHGMRRGLGFARIDRRLGEIPCREEGLARGGDDGWTPVSGRGRGMSLYRLSGVGRGLFLRLSQIGPLRPLFFSLFFFIFLF
jgi:hypothetical protein